MRFESVRIARYGCLADVATPDPLPATVVVLGPNESGKSTFFSFLVDLLYGFSPAARDRHPFAPWSGGRLEGAARMRLDDGSAAEVRRRLGASGSGSLRWQEVGAGGGPRARPGAEEDLRNQPLPAAARVPRRVFAQAYALTLPQLAALEGESWNIVQDRLIAALGLKGLRPARQVADGFEAEAARLWRPDRRGRPRARVLRDELEELRGRRAEALETDRELRAKAAERAAAEAALEAARADAESEREGRKALRRRLGGLLPIRRSLQRIEELRAAAGPRGVLEKLPGDPRERLTLLRGRRREAGDRCARLERDAALCRRTLESYEAGHRAIADGEDRLRGAIAQIEGLHRLERDAEAAEGAVAEMADRCEEHGAKLFSAPWREVSESALAALARPEVAEAVERCEQARAKLRTEEAAESGQSLVRTAAVKRPGSGRAVGGAAAAAGALGLGAWPVFFADQGLQLGQTIVPAAAGLYAAIVLGAAGLIALVAHGGAKRRYRRYQRAAASARERRAARLQELGEEAAAAEAAARELVGDAPLLASLVENPTRELPALIAGMAQLCDRLSEREIALGERQGSLAAARDEIRRCEEWVAERGGGDAAAPVGEPPGSADPAPLDADPAPGDADPPTERAAFLAAVLDRAVRAREGAAAARQNLARIEGERAEADNERDAAQWELGSYEELLEELGGGGAEAGANAAAERLEAWRDAERLGRELERDHPDLDRLRSEIGEAEAAGETWDDLDARMEDAAGRRDGLASRAEELQAELARLETEIDHLREGETADAVGGRIEVVKDQLRETREARDRAFVLARVVRRADRRFREENQPELLLRAGRHLRRITDGRYERVEMGEPGDESFYLRAASDGRLVSVGESVSQGTKEQVYLALRLAIVNHLDADGERLPVFLDETLVNWDAWRRDRAFDLMADLADERQVFIFTCHPAMAAEMEDRGAAVVPLARG